MRIMAAKEEENAEILLTFKSQVAVSVKLVTQMSQDQQHQAWKFWQEVSQYLQKIVSTTFRDPSDNFDELSAETQKSGEPRQTAKPDSDESGLVVPVAEIVGQIAGGVTLSHVNVSEASHEPDHSYTAYVGEEVTNCETPGDVNAKTEGQNFGPLSQFYNATVVSDQLNAAAPDLAPGISNLTCTSTGNDDPQMKEINIVIEANLSESAQNAGAQTFRSKEVRQSPQKKERKPTIRTKGQSCGGGKNKTGSKNRRTDIPSAVGNTGVQGIEALEGGDASLESMDVEKVENSTGDNVGDGSGNRKEERKKRAKVAGNGSFECEICGKEFDKSSSLLVHQRVHTGEKPYLCAICSKGFTTRSNLVRHEATHTGIKPYKCQECQKAFTEKKSLKVHMRTHTGEKPYKCEVCGRQFAQIGILQSHRHLHTGYKGHLCDFCGKSFRQKSNLRMHMLRHDNKRKYKCDSCQASFICAADLKRHQLKHTGERPYLCWLCPKTFTRLQYLKEHINQHTGNKPYSCKKCSAAFPDLSSVHKHMKRHKDNPDINTDSEIVQSVESVQTQLIEEPAYIHEIPLQDDCTHITNNPSMIIEASPVNLGEKPYIEHQTVEVFHDGEQEIKLLNISQPMSTQSFDASTPNIMYIPITDAGKSHMVYVDSTVAEAEGEQVDFSAISLLASASAQAEAANSQNSF